ncbi:MAG: integrase [Geobacteraceae bacterium GWC2_58_44]|nr:MAG: integrase [Geobacteraceae bacterium GWC2_58_44]HBG04684.1 integrase [Geobacter sp.]
MNLSQLIVEYVSFKQAMGMRFRSEAAIFKTFQRCVGDMDLAAIDPDAVSAFLAGRGVITATWHLKYRTLDGLFRFAVSHGYSDSKPLPLTLPKLSEPQVPYIYSTEELCKLLAATDTLEASNSPLQAATFKTLILALYGTGMRIGEVLSLTISDMNLAESLITVHDSKFYKTRLVPIGPRLTSHLQTYLDRRRQLPVHSVESSAFFATRTGNPLSYDWVRKIFARLRNQAGIRRREGATYAPRIHDLRHTFAVHRLELWYREGADVQRLLLHLSTYLGHIDVSQTRYYLQMTPGLLHEAGKRFENYALAGVAHD